MLCFKGLFSFFTVIIIFQYCEEKKFIYGSFLDIFFTNLALRFVSNEVFRESFAKLYNH